ncbi:MAG: 3'-5' exonuclease [Bacteroidota bacterium]
MKYIILDLEATCWEKGGKRNEIIEIGALCIDEEKNTLGEFSEFVRPICHPFLSDFCTQLTTITQADVDRAERFPIVIDNFQNWIHEFDEDYFLCSWGKYDRNQFAKDCQLHGLLTDWLKNHISLKHQYPSFRPPYKLMGMKGALRNENIKLEGTHHRGIDDARNIAKIFLKCFEGWNFEIAEY